MKLGRDSWEHRFILCFLAAALAVLAGIIGSVGLDPAAKYQPPSETAVAWRYGLLGLCYSFSIGMSAIILRREIKKTGARAEKTLIVAAHAIVISGLVMLYIIFTRTNILEQIDAAVLGM